MKRKQWVLLITMSSVLIASILTIVLLLLSDTELKNLQNPQIEENIVEPADPAETEDQEAEKENREEVDPDHTGSSESNSSSDSIDTVNEWFDKPSDQKNDSKSEEINSPQDSDSDKKSSNNDSEDTIEIQLPIDPVEPEIQFENQN